MEKINQIILEQLRKNPTKSYNKISKELGISSNTVKKRVQKMVNDHIIFGTSLILDLSKIGFHGKIFLFIKNSKNHDSLTNLENFKKIPNLFAAIDLIGTFDILLMIVFRSIVEVKQIVNEIRLNPGVDLVKIAFTDDAIVALKEEYDDVQI
jgi:DNA-binding Lrp family transcriptional regulator